MNFLVLSTPMTLNDLEPPKGVLVNFFRNSWLQCTIKDWIATIAGNRPRQPAYKIFSTKRRFQQFKSRSPRLMEAGAGERKKRLPTPPKWLFYRNYLV